MPIDDSHGFFRVACGAVILGIAFMTMGATILALSFLRKRQS